MFDLYKSLLDFQNSLECLGLMCWKKAFSKSELVYKLAPVTLVPGATGIAHSSGEMFE